MKLVFSRQIFEKRSNIKFHENPSSGSRVVPCGQMETDMTKLTVAFRHFANAPKMAVTLFQRSLVVTVCTTLYDVVNSRSSDHTVYLRVPNDSDSNQLLFSRRAVLSSNTDSDTNEDGTQFLIQINWCVQTAAMPSFNQTFIKSYCKCKLVNELLCVVS